MYLYMSACVCVAISRFPKLLRLLSKHILCCLTDCFSYAPLDAAH